jgi:hypothetical protein
MIDFHTYLGRDAYGDHVQTADDLIASMDDCGIDRAVVAPLQDTPGPDPRAHQTLWEAVQRFPERLVPFARVDPRYGDRALEALSFAVDELGFCGVLFNPAMTCSLPYHPQVLPLMGHAAERDVPVLIPAGDAYRGLPEQIALLAEQLPSLTLIIGHMGTAAHALRAIALAARHANLYLETSLQQSPYRVPVAVNQAGAERVLFGSAAPYGHPYPEWLKVKVAGLPPDVEALVLGGNARRLLGLDAVEVCDDR